MFVRHSSRLVQVWLNGVILLYLAAAFLGLRAVWQKGGEMGEVAAAGPTVLITQNGFDPVLLTVSLGESVTWFNSTDKPVEIGSSRHCYQYLPLLMAQTGEGSVAAAIIPLSGNGWASGAIAPGTTYSTTFLLQGDYPVYLDCRYDVMGTIRVHPVTPSPTPSSSPTNPPTATFTPSLSPTPSPSTTPTPTFGPSPTPGFCPTQFERPVRAGDQFVPVTGDLHVPPPTPVELYWINGSGNVLIAQSTLEDHGPGHLCPGSAEFYIDPSQFVLVAGMLLIVINQADGSSDYTWVMPATPTPIPLAP